MSARPSETASRGLATIPPGSRATCPYFATTAE